MTGRAVELKDEGRVARECRIWSSIKHVDCLCFPERKQPWPKAVMAACMGNVVRGKTLYFGS